MNYVSKIDKPKKNATTGERIEYLRRNSLMKQKDLAEILRKDRAQITKMENGTKFVDTDTLKELAKIFNVSTDYLLGLTETETPNTDIISMSNLTGLTEKAIANLIHLNKYHNGYLLSTINYLLEQETIYPDAYYSLINEENIINPTETELIKYKELGESFKDWKKNNFIKVISAINNYLNLEIKDGKLYMFNPTIENTNNIYVDSFYEYRLNQQIADLTALKQIEELLENAKQDFKNSINRNEEE